MLLGPFPALNTEGASAEEYYRGLLEMQAGAQSEDDFVVDADVDVDFDWEDAQQGMPSESEDEAGTEVSDALLKLLQQKVQRHSRDRLCKDSKGRWRCLFCPFQAWPAPQSKGRVVKHLQQYSTTAIGSSTSQVVQNSASCSLCCAMRINAGRLPGGSTWHAA